MRKINLNKRLNIFIDETGEFGFGKKSATYYGVSFVCHEQGDSIKKHLERLTERLEYLNFGSMVHMGELVAGHGDFEGMSIAERRKVYIQLYKFATSVPAYYHSVILDKRILNTNPILKNTISQEIQTFVLDNLEYLQQFDEIKIYYDDGQKPLRKIIDNVFGRLGGYERKTEFNHTEKKLFQVADMLTYIDKLIYKYDHKIKFTKTEMGFFSYKDINRIKRELRGHRLQQKQRF